MLNPVYGTSEPMHNNLNAAPPQGLKSATEELRAKVEEAKQLYKAQKYAYRQERVRRRATRGEIPVGMQPSTSGSSREPVEVTWLASSQHGVPKRAHTHIGHVVRRHGYKPEDLNAGAQNRIIKKLVDMGFTENLHPNLPEKIATLLSTNDAISQDQEDEIVTTLLEELILLPPKPSQATTGGKNDKFPGAWQ